MNINKAYIFRLYPNDNQKELIEKSFGCSRYIYNYFLGLNNNYINKYDCMKQLPVLEKENEWLKEVDSFLYSISKKLTDENDIIVAEKLNIKGMVQNKHLSKYIMDTSWYELIRQIRYKCEWKGKC